MKGNIFTDIAAGVKATKKIRELRKEGADGVTVAPVKRIPMLGSVGCGFYDTMEGCAIGDCHSSVSREGRRSAQKAFHALDEDTRHRFSCSPKDGEFVIRARYFAELLRPVLSPKDYHNAMIALLRWDRHVKNGRHE